MASINDLREPIEVYEAAAGDPTALIEYLRSDAYIGEWMREALAAYLAGELEPKLPRSRTKRKHVQVERHLQAKKYYDFLVEYTKQEQGSIYRQADKLKEQAAETFGLNSDQFKQDFHRITRAKFVYGLRARYLDWYRNKFKK